ncbi:MAG: YDG domain-containing protein, partial [Ilumatobacteraceae bacterium]
LDHVAAAFADKNAGTAKTVTFSGYALADGSAPASNYSIHNATATASATITPRDISSVTGLIASNKVYDRSTSAAINVDGAALSSIIAGDLVTVASATGFNFADTNVGTHQVNPGTLSLTGADAANYQLSNTLSINSLSAAITPRSITSISGITASNKEYDGTTQATLSTANATFAGLVDGDTLALSSSVVGAFDSVNVGQNRSVLISGLALAGTDAANYIYTGTGGATTTASITPRQITAVTGINVADKTYDSTTAAFGLNASSAVLTGLVSGETLRIVGGSASFADANVSVSDGSVVNKTVTISGYTLGDATGGASGLASNYQLATAAQTSTAQAKINPILISSITGLTAANKTYDTYADATINLTGAVFGGALAGDTLALTTVTGAFSNASVGTAKAVSLTGATFTVNGATTQNYALAPTVVTNNITASITPATITAVTGLLGLDRVYDKT